MKVIPGATRLGAMAMGACALASLIVVAPGETPAEATSVTDGTTTVTLTNPPDLVWDGTGKPSLRNGTWSVSKPDTSLVCLAVYTIATNGSAYPYTGQVCDDAVLFPATPFVNTAGTAPGPWDRFELIAYTGCSTRDFNGKYPGGATGCSSLGVLATFTIGAREYPPLAPTSPSAQAGNLQAQISWQAPATDATHGPATHYWVTVSTTSTNVTSSNCDAVPGETKVFSTNGLSCTFEGLTTNQQGARIQARSSLADGVQDGSDTTALVYFTPTATRPGPAESLAFASAPAGGAATVTLSWAGATPSVANGETTSYEVSVLPDGYLCNINGTPTRDVTVTSCQVHTSIELGKALTAEIIAKNSVGSAAGVTLDYTVPNVPQAPVLVGDVGVLSVDLSMTHDDGGSPITSTVIERSVDGGGWEQISNQTEVTYADSALTQGSAYEYRARAENAFGVGAYSEVVSFIAGNYPAPPTGVSAEFRDSEATVSWEAPVDTGGIPILRYAVQMSANDGDWVSVSESPASSQSRSQFVRLTSADLSRIVSGLSNASSYRFRVASENALGISAFSDPSPSGRYTAPTTSTAPPTSIAPTTTAAPTGTAAPTETTMAATTDDPLGVAIPETGANVSLIWLLMLGAGCLLVAASRRPGVDE